MKYETSQPYSASYVVVRQDGKIGLVLRSNTNWMNNYYGLPSGKVEQGESFTQAAVREAKEEIGIDIDLKNLTQILTMQRKEPGIISNEWVDVFFEPKKWRGKPHNAEPHMHSEFIWIDPKKLPNNIVPSVQYALNQILAGNKYCEYGY